MKRIVASFSTFMPTNYSEAYPALPDGGVLLRSRQLFILAQP